MADIDTIRNAYVTTTLPQGRLLLEEMTGREALGQVFEYDLSLLSLDPNVDLAALLKEPMTVHVVTGEGERIFNGVVARAQFLGPDSQYMRYQVTLRPWLWLLSFSTNCRIFQDMTVLEIIKEVFRDAGFSDFRENQLGHYEPREFCVQYCESDFDFVSRLMEDEGIYYFFEHEGDKHTLALTDDSLKGHVKTPGFETIIYRPPHEHHGMEREHLSRWALSNQVRSGSFAANDFDFMVPRGNLLRRVEEPNSQAFSQGELYEYPGNYVKKKKANEDLNLVTPEKRQPFLGQAADDLVKLRLEERWADFAIVDAGGDVRGIGAGALFTFAEYPREDQNKDYLVLTASYQIHGGNFISGGGGEQDEFKVSLTLLDSQVRFRPPRYTPKARVNGPQTAIVVGPDGEEILVDKYGRVKVQFHWDRFVKKPEQASCWVRVSQAWAGAKWGSMHIPRIGQEVIVDFLEGDPDRPIITGRVYNFDQMPPYDLPANKTQSGIKSRSTPKGGPTNFNEIRFEDKKGSEELYVHAERSHTTVVKGSQSISVGGDRSLSVKGKESVDIKKTRTTVIGEKETQTFSDAREMTVAKTDTETITGEHTGTYHGGREITADKFDNTTVNSANKNTTVHGQFNITADEHFKITQGGNQIFVKDQVYVETTGELQLKNAKGHLDMKDGVLTLTSSDELTLVCGSAKISMKKDGTITVTGIKTSISGSAGTEISGATVKING